jgi:hypothetical protein
MAHSTTRRAQRLGAASGVIFIVLYFVSTAILVGSITQSDSLSKARRVFNDQADSLDVGSALLALSIPFLLYFAATLYSVLVATEGGDRRWAVLSIVGATGGGAGLLAGAAVSGGVSFLAESATVDGATAATAHSISEALIFYSLTYFGVMALATSRVALGRGALSRWFGWIAAVLGFCMIVGSAGSPIVRPLALLANIPMWLYFLIGAIAVWRAPATSGQES